jgi:hypothetical protein
MSSITLVFGISADVQSKAHTAGVRSTPFRMPCRDGASDFVTRRDRCGATNWKSVPLGDARTAGPYIRVKDGRGNDASGMSLIPPHTCPSCCGAEIFRPVPIPSISRCFSILIGLTGSRSILVNSRCDQRVAPNTSVVTFGHHTWGIEVECPSCRVDAPQGARFCPACGSAMPGACAACGQATPAGARFCPSCGTIPRSSLPRSLAPLHAVVRARAIKALGLATTSLHQRRRADGGLHFGILSMWPNALRVNPDAGRPVSDDDRLDAVMGPAVP